MFIDFLSVFTQPRPEADGQNMARPDEFWENMITLKIMAAVFAIVVGIPSQIIDYKHRKRNAYEPGNAWGYYAALGSGGSWEGRFMMWSGRLGIAIVLGALGFLFHAFFK